MTAQEKAVELVNKYFDATDRWIGSTEDIKFRVKCALIAVDEIIPIVESYEDALSASQKSDELAYWQEVKQEIEKL